MEQFTHVYIIYSADVIADSSRAIEQMSPASHAPELADFFAQTEGDEQYDYDYLASECGDKRYLALADAPGDVEDWPGQGQHRKWVGELTREQWVKFAEYYCIDLDENSVPVDYTETMGSITEYGHLDAIAIDNTDGWGCAYWGYEYVLDSQMYVSFGYVEEDDK